MTEPTSTLVRYEVDEQGAAIVTDLPMTATSKIQKHVLRTTMSTTQRSAEA